MEVKFYPSSYIESYSRYKSVDTDHPFETVYGKDENSDVYTQVYMTDGGSKTSKICYGFDVSSIPRNAIITSVSCRVKVQASNASIFVAGNTNCFLRSGNTKIGSGTSNGAFGTTATTIDVPTGEWTRDQLDSCNLLIQSSRGLLQTSSSQWIRFYGATLTVNYTMPDGLYAKSNGKYVYVAAAYKKINSVWTEQTDLTALFDTSTHYVKSQYGGE